MATTFIEKVTLGPVKKVICEWTSDGSGDASGTTTNAISGKVVGLTTIPDGVAAPTDNYDVVVTDSEGHDVLLGAGANRDTANTEHVTSASLAVIVASTLTFTISNAGDTKEGTIILYIE